MDLTEKSEFGTDVNDFIEFAEHLKERISKLGSVQGLKKLERKIGAELKFMTQLQQRDQHTQQSRLRSSNLGHLASLVHAAELLPGLAGVLVPYQLPTRHDSLLVDLLALRGHAWVKIVARKAQALHLVWAGAGRFGERDLLWQAHEYLECTTRHPVNFCTPQVHFAFYNQVTESMASALEQLGVKVWGERVPVNPTVLEKLQGLVCDDSSEDSGSCSGDDSHDDFDPDEKAKDKRPLRFDSVSQTSQVPFRSDQFHQRSLKGLTTNRNETDGDQLLRPVTEITQSVSDSSKDSNHHTCSSLHPEPASAGIDSTASAEPARVAYERERRMAPLVKKQLFLELVISPPNFESFRPKSDLSKHPKHNLPVADSPSSVATYLSGCPSVQSPEGVSEIQRVNLDITSLIALVSSVTNGRCNFVFQDKVLTEQAREEREDPVLPALNRFLAGKQLFACETAVSSFRSILNILGGAEENQRASDFLAQVTIVPDQPSSRAQELKCQGRVKERSKVVFGTGDSLHAVTVTSNMGFVRAAQSQGVNFPVFLHSARALTEEKEPNAKPLEL